MGSSASYTELIHKLGGPAMNGFYSTNTVNVPYLDDASRTCATGPTATRRSTRKTGGVLGVRLPGGGSLRADREQDRRQPDTDSFIKTLESFSSSRDMFGADSMSFSKTKHLGSNRARLSQIVNGKWTR